MKYYKYRSLANKQSISRFEDIIRSKTLYGSRFDKLNDPMEGYFRCLHEDAPSVLQMTLLRQDALICSLSRRYNIGLMWSHYADEHNGCCIEVEVTDTSWQEVIVDYNEKPFRIAEDSCINDILKIKSPQWKFEEEVRFVCLSNEISPMNVNITNIFWGMRMDNQKVEEYNNLVSRFLPNVHPTRLDFASVDFGFINDKLKLV